MAAGDAPYRIRGCAFGQLSLALPVRYVCHEVKGGDLILVTFLDRPDVRAGQRGYLLLDLMTIDGDCRMLRCGLREVLSVTEQLRRGPLETTVRFKPCMED